MASNMTRGSSRKMSARSNSESKWQFLLAFLALLSGCLTGCFEMTGLNIAPTVISGSVSTADENAVKAILAAAAKKYDLQRVPNAVGEIVAYQGGRAGLLPRGIAYVRLWRVDNSGHPQDDKPTQLETDIGAPSPGARSSLSKQIFGEVKAQLRERFGSRVRDTSVTIVNWI